MMKKIASMLLAASMFAAVAVTASAAAPAMPENLPEVSIEEENYTDSQLGVFEYAYAGVGDDSNYYFMVINGDVDYGGLVILSEDGTQSMNAVGSMIDNGDGTVTIDDTTSGYTLTFAYEFTDGGMYIQLANGTVVTMGEADVDEVVNIILAIDEGTEIINPLA